MGVVVVNQELVNFFLLLLGKRGVRQDGFSDRHAIGRQVRCIEHKLKHRRGVTIQKSTRSKVAADVIKVVVLLAQKINSVQGFFRKRRGGLSPWLSLLIESVDLDLVIDQELL